MKVAFNFSLIFFVFQIAKAEHGKCETCGNFENFENFEYQKFGDRLEMDSKIPWLVSLSNSKFIGAFLRSDLILAPIIDQSRIGNYVEMDLDTAVGSFRRFANVTAVQNYNLIRLDSPVNEIEYFSCLPESDFKSKLIVGRPIYVLEYSEQVLYTGKVHENPFTELQIFSDDFGVRLSQEAKEITKSFAMIEEDRKLYIVGVWTASLGPGAPNYDPEFSDHIFKAIHWKSDS